MQAARIIVLLTLSGAWSAAAGQQCIDLFDGHSLDGWTALGEAEYVVENGTITGRAVHGVPNSYLRTDDTYGDFELSLEFNVDEDFNSGVQFRSMQAVETLRSDHQAGNGRQFTMVSEPGKVVGYQAEIDPTDRGWSAEIYEQGARGWLQTFSREPVRRLIQPGTWHRMRIRAEGTSVSTWLDGEPVAELSDSARSAGFIALQVHQVRTPGEAGKTVRFRGLRLCGVE